MKWYIKNFFTSVSLLFGALFYGRSVVRKETNVGDWTVYYPTHELALSALDYAIRMMKLEEWSWIKDTEDCRKFATKAKCEITHFIKLSEPKSHGLNPWVSTFHYTKDTGTDHVIVSITTVDGKKRFYEPQYMDERSKVELTLSQNEVNNCYLEIF